MSSPTVQTGYLDGQEVLASDLQSNALASSSFAGEAMAAIAGVESVNSNDFPLTVSAVGGMAVSIGGANERATILGVLCDYLPATTYTVSGASGQDRYDGVFIQPFQNQVNPFSANFLSNSGVVSTGTAYQIVSTALIQIIAGTAGAGVPPATPTGWVPLATIYVPANTTAIVSGDITMVLPTMASRIAAYAGAGSTVSSLNSKSGALALESTDGSVIIDATNPAGGLIDIRVASPAGGTTGSTSSIAALAGIAFYSKYVNYGTQYSSPLPSNADNLTPLASILGGCNLSATQNTGGGSTIEAHFKLRVKAGSGAQPVGGIFNSNARHQFISLDGSIFYTAGLATTTQTWATNIADDGAVHTLIFHFDLSHSDGQFFGEVAPWLPQSSTGGIDATKFALVGPGY